MDLKLINWECEFYLKKTHINNSNDTTTQHGHTKNKKRKVSF